MDFKLARGIAATSCFAVAGLLLMLPSLLPAQTIGTGNIAGEITDPSGKPIAGTKVDITNKATTAVIHVTTSPAGWYSSGPIQPGNYSLRVEAKGLNTTHLTFGVHVGNTTTANIRMQLGPEGPVVEILGGTQVNVTQATVQDVIAEDPMHRLPINARDLFDFAQLDPDVQMQDGGVLDGSTPNHRPGRASQAGPRGAIPGRPIPCWPIPCWPIPCWPIPCWPIPCWPIRCWRSHVGDPMLAGSTSADLMSAGANSACPQSACPTSAKPRAPAGSGAPVLAVSADCSRFSWFGGRRVVGHRRGWCRRSLPGPVVGPDAVPQAPLVGGRREAGEHSRDETGWATGRATGFPRLTRAPWTPR